MQESLLYDKLKDGAVRCNICQWRCRVNPGRLGYCRTRQNRDGTLYTLIYDVVSSVAVDPIEKKPLAHFYPGTLVFSLGTLGCNFRCQHCQNWHISYAEYDGEAWRVEGVPQREGDRLSPAQEVALAKRHGCQGIAWTYNEPSIWLEHTLEAAKLAKAENLYTVYVTNGFLTPEGLDLMGPYLDAYRVDVKGFTAPFYRRLAKLTKPHALEGILEVAVRAKEKWGMHVEVVNNIIPTYNDDDEQLAGLAAWIRQALGPLTPLHITRFYPHAHLSHLPPTPISTLERGRRLAIAEGLQFVYVGNVPDNEGENTYCYQCRRLVIRRYGYHTELLAVAGGGRCAHCGADLNIRGLGAKELV